MLLLLILNLKIIKLGKVKITIISFSCTPLETDICIVRVELGESSDNQCSPHHIEINTLILYFYLVLLLFMCVITRFLSFIDGIASW